MSEFVYFVNLGIQYAKFIWFFWGVCTYFFFNVFLMYLPIKLCLSLFWLEKKFTLCAHLQLMIVLIVINMVYYYFMHYYNIEKYIIK